MVLKLVGCDPPLAYKRVTFLLRLVTQKWMSQWHHRDHNATFKYSWGTMQLPRGSWRLASLPRSTLLLQGAPVCSQSAFPICRWKCRVQSFHWWPLMATARQFTVLAGAKYSPVPGAFQCKLEPLTVKRACGRGCKDPGPSMRLHSLPSYI